MSDRTTSFAMLLPFLVTTATAAATLDEIEAQVVKKWEPIKSMAADMTMTMNLNAPTPLKSTGKFEYLRENDLDKKRIEMSFLFGGNDETKTISQTVIFDGEYVWTVREYMGKQLVAKDRPDAMEGTPGGRQTFAQLRDAYTLKVLPDETVEGAACYVIEGTPKRETGRKIAKYHFYFAKDTGMLLRTVGFNQEGERATLIAYTNIKINPDLEPDRFVFRGGENTGILDRTKQESE